MAAHKWIDPTLAMDHLLESLTGQLYWRTRYREDPRSPWVAHKAREYLHAHLWA